MGQNKVYIDTLKDGRVFIEWVYHLILLEEYECETSTMKVCE